MIAPSALRALAQQASDGPWVADPAFPRTVGAIDPISSEGEWLHLVADAQDADDAAFIAACDPQTILALLDAVEAARSTEFALSQMIEDGVPADFSANVGIALARLRAALAADAEATP